MAGYLRRNTTTNVPFGPLVAASDGYSYLATTVTLSASNVVIFKADGTVTELATGAVLAIPRPGWVLLTVAASDVTSCGRIKYSLRSVPTTIANMPVWREYHVVSETVYDSLILGSDLLQVDVQQVTGSAASDATFKVVSGVNVIQINGAAPTNTVFEVNVRTITGAAVSAAFAGYVIPVNVLQITGAAPSAAIAGYGIHVSSVAAGVGVNVSSVNAGVGVNVTSINGGAVSNANLNAKSILSYVMFTPGVQTITLEDTIRVAAAVLGGKADGATGAAMRFYGPSGRLHVSAAVVSGNRTGTTWVTGVS